MKTYYVGNMPVSDELYHHGIKGQKWGIRRYQNSDGTLTGAGRARYSIGDSEHELGFGNKRRLNTVEKRLRDLHRGNKISEDRQYQKAAKAQFKGKDPTKYINKAKQFAKGADFMKAMATRYNSLDMREQKRINRRVVAMELGAYSLAGIPGMTFATLNNSRYLSTKLG